MMKLVLPMAFIILFAAAAGATEPLQTDTFPTTSGDLEITFVGHGSLMFTFMGRVIHVDPYGKLTDYSRLPKADIVFLTHEHRDHLDPAALAMLRKPETETVLTKACAEEIGGGLVMQNGDRVSVQGIDVEAVPAYNRVHQRSNGQPFHPKGIGNGYVLTFGGLRVYVGGDTEDIPEMKTLEGIGIAFLPMNLPYTMTPAMVAEAARGFRPKILYPYHYGDTNPEELVTLLKDDRDIEVRIRKMQ